jgi:hypothetical protein
MRMPLGTGLPILLTGNSTYDTVYSLVNAISDLQSRVNLVTLYAIVVDGTPGASDLNLRVTADGTDYLLSTFTLADLVTYQSSNRAMRKVLDRFPLRGNASISVMTDVDPVTQSVYLVGYVELEGSYEPTRPIRPFQPGALTTPYTYAPVNIAFASPAVVHAFEEGYTDEITLHFRTAGLLSPKLTFDDGASSITLTLSAMAQNDETWTLLEGIPIQAQGSGGITAEAPLVTDVILVWGTFTRR